MQFTQNLIHDNDDVLINIKYLNLLSKNSHHLLKFHRKKIKIKKSTGMLPFMNIKQHVKQISKIAMKTTVFYLSFKYYFT